MAKLPAPVEILGAKDPKEFLDRISELTKSGTGKRVDLISTICTRLLIELGRKDANLPKTSATNLIALLMSDALPGDMRFSLHRDLSSMTSTATPGAKVAAEVCKDPGVAKLVLKAM